MTNPGAAPRQPSQRWAGQAIHELRQGRTAASLVVKVLAGLIVASLVAAIGIGGASFGTGGPAPEKSFKTSRQEAATPVEERDDVAGRQDSSLSVLDASAGRQLFMVPPCDLASRDDHSQDLREACRTMIEDAITGGGGRIVERNKLDAVLEETSFQQYSGMVDPASASKVGRVLGATYLAICTIVNADVQRKSFSGYGVRTKSLVYQVALRLRVVNVETGEVMVSRTSEGSFTEMSSKYGGVEQTDGMFKALTDAIKHMNLESLVQ